MMKAIALLRKSTTEEGRQALSFDRQLDIIRQRAKSDGATIGEVLRYSNPGAETTHLEGALAAVQANGTKRVYVADASRFGRFPDLWAAGFWLTHFHQAGGEIVTANNGRSSRSTSPADFLVSCIEHMQSSQENRDRSARTLTGQATAAKRGHFVGGTTPFGFDRMAVTAAGEPVAVLRQVSAVEWHLLSPDGDVIRTFDKRPGTMPRDKESGDYVVLSVNPEQAPVVREIFDLCTGGVGFAGIAGVLNERGIPGPRDVWQERSVRSILTNPVYLGQRRWNAKHRRSGLNRLGADGLTDTMPEQGGVDVNEEAAWVIALDAHEPIIDKATWHKAQAAMKRRRGGRPVGSSPQGSQHLLTGLIVCAECGGAWKGKSARRKASDGSVTTYRYYRCRVRHVSGKAACPSCAVRAGDLEAGVLAGVRQFYGLDSDRETWEEVLRAKFNEYIPDAAPDTEPLQKQLDDIQNRISAVMDGLDPANVKMVDRKLTAWRQEAEALRSDIAAGEAQAALSFDVDELVCEALSDLARLAEVLTEATVSERRAVLGTALDRVEIDSERGVARAFVNPSPCVGPNRCDATRDHG